jgi:transposase
LRRIGDQLGINPETLRNWVTQAEIDEGHRPGTTTDDATRLAELEREVRELRRANAILKSAAAESTGQRNSSAASLSAGVSKFSVLRGREFSFAAMASRSCWVR